MKYSDKCSNLGSTYRGTPQNKAREPTVHVRKMARGIYYCPILFTLPDQLHKCEECAYMHITDCTQNLTFR